MHICPDCLQPKQSWENPCPSCNTHIEFVDSIPVLLSQKDKKKEMFRDYCAIYEQCAMDDLEKSIQDPEYLVIQTNKLFSYLPNLTNLSICEVGVGQGLLLKKLLTCFSLPAKVVGVDVAIAYLKQLIKEKIPFEPVIANAENLPYEDEFDLIISTDVMEHVLSVGDFLHSIYRALKKTGTFIMRTPYLEDYSVYSRIKGYKYDIMHLRNFSTQTLKIVLKGAGFKIVKFHYDGYMDHRRRIPSSSLLGRVISKCLYSFYKTHLHLPAIPNWIGRFFMVPSEITAVCQKI